MEIFKNLADEVEKGHSETVKELIEKALSQDISAEEILYKGLVIGMDIIGEKFKNNECFIPEVLVAAKAMNAGLEIIKPLLAEANVKSQGKVVIAVKDEQADVVGMSALLTTTMPYMKEVIEALKSEGLRRKIKVIIGGAPVTESYAETIGADGYAPDAASAVDLTKGLLK